MQVKAALQDGKKMWNEARRIGGEWLERVNLSICRRDFSR